MSITDADLRYGPCASWCPLPDEEDEETLIPCCRGLDLTDADTRARFEQMAGVASSALYHRTWQRFNGICEATELLCRKTGLCYSTAETALPVPTGSGTWVNCACGQPCTNGCDSTRFLLPYQPVQAVSAVEINGVALDDSAWVVMGGYLVRVDGGTWPQLLTVTWTYGTPPPVDGALSRVRAGVRVD